MPKKKSPQKNIAPSDFAVAINQSTADKLLSSVRYPFTVFDYRKPFPQKLKLEDSSGIADYIYKDPEVKIMLKKASNSGSLTLTAPSSQDLDIYSQIHSSAGSLIEQAKKCLDSMNTKDHPYSGPNESDLRAIVDNGIEGLADQLKGIKFKAHLSELKLTSLSQPQLQLATPRIDLKEVKVQIRASGELWWYHPELHCSRWCTKWSITWKWSRIASITVSPKFAADAHANAEADGPRVKIVGSFDKLELDYPILRDIVELKSIANQLLGDRFVFAFDASKFIATIPVINSRFSVNSIILPPTTGSVAIGVVVKQI